MSGTDELCRSFLDLWWHFDPAAGTQAGTTASMGRMGSFDPESVREHVVALKSIAGAVEDQDVEELPEEIDRTALLDHLRVLIFRFEKEAPHRKNPAFWTEHACLAFDGLLARAELEPGAPAAALERIRALPKFLTDARDTLRDPPQVLVDTALVQLAGLSSLLDDCGSRFGEAWIDAEEDGPAAIAEAEAAIRHTGHALRNEIAPDPEPGSAAIGEDEVDRRLHHEHASVHNGAEVWRAANRLAGELEEQIIALAAAIDPGRPWRDVFEDLAGEEGDPDPAAWREALARSSLLAGLAGADGDELAALIPVAAPDFALVTDPIAAYRPGRGGAPARLQVAGGTEAELPWLSARYGIPGMHLQQSVAAEQPRQVRRWIEATSVADGYGLYGQELARLASPGADPATLLVERVLALREAHLAVADLGMHTRQFTPADAAAYLTARLPLTRKTAEADVRRLASRPTSAAAAFLGRRELLRLREDVRAARGSSFVDPDFHRELLGYGGIPVPLMRWGMGLDD